MDAGDAGEEGMSVGFGPRDLNRHARLQNARLVVDIDANPVHQSRAFLGGLDVARRELGAWRDPGARNRSMSPQGLVVVLTDVNVSPNGWFAGRT